MRTGNAVVEGRICLSSTGALLMLRPVVILDSISVEAIAITLRPVNAADGLASLGIVPLLAGGPRAPRLDVEVDGGSPCGEL